MIHTRTPVARVADATVTFVVKIQHSRTGNFFAH